MSDWNDKMIAEFREGDGTTGQFGRGLVIMHTIGARSGQERLIPVVSMRSDNGWLVMASAAGAPQHPGWYHNLKKHPEFEIEAAADGGGIETAQVTAVELNDDEYPAAWTTFTTEMPGFLEYEKTAQGRRMPLFELKKV
ncbi:MAG TPA: nitroreductase/quinone reductase family protein [Pseudolysinimonas sp.]|nr:nitroreductase/quinone reductase family protein [Pseudolysinimonas sp.]